MAEPPPGPPPAAGSAARPPALAVALPPEWDTAEHELQSLTSRVGGRPKRPSQPKRPRTVGDALAAPSKSPRPSPLGDHVLIAAAAAVRQAQQQREAGGGDTGGGGADIADPLPPPAPPPKRRRGRPARQVDMDDDSDDLRELQCEPEKPLVFPTVIEVQRGTPVRWRSGWPLGRGAGSARAGDNPTLASVAPSAPKGYIPPPHLAVPIPGPGIRPVYRPWPGGTIPRPVPGSSLYTLSVARPSPSPVPPPPRPPPVSVSSTTPASPAALARAHAAPAAAPAAAVATFGARVEPTKDDETAARDRGALATSDALTAAYYNMCTSGGPRRAPEKASAMFVLTSLGHLVGLGTLAVLVDRGPNKRRVKPVNLDLIEYQLLGEGAEDTARALQAVAPPDSGRAAVALLGGDISPAAAAEDADYVEPEPPAPRSPAGSPQRARGSPRRSPPKHTPSKATGSADLPSDAAAADAPREDAAADASTVPVTTPAPPPPPPTAAPLPAAPAPPARDAAVPAAPARSSPEPTAPAPAATTAAEATPAPAPATPSRPLTRADRRAKAEVPALAPPALDRDVEDGMVIVAARDPLSLQLAQLARWPSEGDAGAAGSGQITAATSYHDQLVAWVRRRSVAPRWTHRCGGARL